MEGLKSVVELVAVGDERLEINQAAANERHGQWAEISVCITRGKRLTSHQGHSGKSRKL
jgi:hypothetical protein